MSPTRPPEQTSVAQFDGPQDRHIMLGGEPKVVPFTANLRLPAVELIKLYQTLAHALSGDESKIVQFISTYHGEGANLIGYEWAVVAATQFGLRVLYVDTALSPKGGKSDRFRLSAAVQTPLGVLLQTGGNLSDAQVALAGTSLVYTALRRPNDQSSILFNLGLLDELLKTLRGTYDVIVIPSPGVGADVLSLSLAKLVDASVLVVEAEHTRLPVVERTFDTMRANGGRVIGVILNKRRYYIPRWLYKWL